MGRAREMTTTVAFDDPALSQRLDEMGPEDLDRVGFGVIAVDEDDKVVVYNRFESRRAGFGADRVLGRDLFVDVAPCTNNYLVAERYHRGEDLDEQMDYVFTFKMAPTPVRLRLLARTGARRRYLLIRPR